MVTLDKKRQHQLRDTLRGFPPYYANVLSSSHTSVVVFVRNRGEIVAACGIHRPFNYLVTYVREGHRGRGLGTIASKKIISTARRRNLNFINMAVSTENIPSLRLYTKLGFRETALFPKFKFKVMTLPLTTTGRLVYHFFHKACSMFPETLQLYLVILIMSLVKRAH